VSGHTPTPWAKEYIGDQPTTMAFDRPTVFYIGDYRVVVENARGYDLHERDDKDADFIIEAVNSYEANTALIQKLTEALVPFARFSETYPNADPDAEAGTVSCFDPRCPVFVRDYHRAREVLSLVRKP
jgi:hypothetical protein